MKNNARTYTVHLCCCLGLQTPQLQMLCCTIPLLYTGSVNGTFVFTVNEYQRMSDAQRQGTNHLTPSILQGGHFTICNQMIA